MEIIKYVRYINFLNLNHLKNNSKKKIFIVSVNLFLLIFNIFYLLKTNITFIKLISKQDEKFMFINKNNDYKNIFNFRFSDIFNI